MKIWHDPECQGYECGCTTHPSPGYWHTDEDGDKIVYEPLLAKKAQQEQERNRRRANRDRIMKVYGEDDFPNGTVVRFYKMYQKDGKLYDFVANKCNFFWYVTSREDRLTWINLMEFFEEGNLLDVSFFFIATKFEQLFEEENDETGDNK